MARDCNPSTQGAEANKMAQWETVLAAEADRRGSTPTPTGGGGRNQLLHTEVLWNVYILVCLHVYTHTHRDTHNL